MKHYGPRQISLDQVQNNYESIVNNTHFIAPKNKTEIDIKGIPNLKPISPEMIPLLMALGLDGIHFLNKILRYPEFSWLTSQEQWEAYCLCDGFGKKTPEELKEINDGWDWSHIRDSSPEAIKDAENFVKEKLITLYNHS